MIGDGYHPAFTLIFGTLLIPLLQGRLRNVYLLLLPSFALLQLIGVSEGAPEAITVFGYTLNPLRADGLGFFFAFAFIVAAFLNNLFALHVKDTLQHIAANVYAGAAVGAALAGDLITLFIYWELTAVASVFLIWAQRTERATRCGIRYLIWQVSSGVLLLGGAALHYRSTGSLAFEAMTLCGPGAWLMFIAFGIKAAFPLLHNWMIDAYPEATPTGSVVLSAFTTKLAIYALARAFAGTELLIVIGAVMTIFPIFYAVVENDFRRVLAYSLNIQLGFMVVGIGVGTELALNGVAAHAFCHIIYKALLFMSMGAVLYRAGTVKGSELGGLFRAMPKTAIACMVGAASISAVPWFSGFVSKSMILGALAHEHHQIAWLTLLAASAGIFLYCAIRIPYFTFFGEDRKIECEEAPSNMIWAMGIASFLCVFIGVVPGVLYALLPFEAHGHPYTFSHVLTQFQLLVFSAAAFVLLLRYGLYPRPKSSISLDTDWFYRKPGAAVGGFFLLFVTRVPEMFVEFCGILLKRVTTVLSVDKPKSFFSQAQPTGVMAFWVAVLMALCLIFYYLN